MALTYQRNSKRHVANMILFFHTAEGFFLFVILVPWCASWPFSASSVWCVWCCLDLKAPASSTAPGTAVVWHVCKHTSTGWVSRHPPAEKWDGTYANRLTRADPHIPEGQKHILFLLHCDCHVLLLCWKTCTKAARMATEYYMTRV